MGEVKWLAVPPCLGCALCVGSWEVPWNMTKAPSGIRGSWRVLASRLLLEGRAPTLSRNLPLKFRTRPVWVFGLFSLSQTELPVRRKIAL